MKQGFWPLASAVAVRSVFHRRRRLCPNRADFELLRLAEDVGHQQKEGVGPQGFARGGDL